MKNEAIEQYIERVTYLPDLEYGDFKRKLDLATMQLWRSLGNGEKTDPLFWDLKHKTVYNKRIEVEEARMLALNMADELRTLV